MLYTHFMVRTYYRPLKKAPDAFDAVCMDIAVHPFFLGMVDCLVARVVIADAAIRNILICINSLGIRLGRFVNELMKRVTIDSAQSFDANWAFALESTNNCDLILAIAAAHVPTFPAHVGFIHLDDALKLSGVDVLHG